MGASSPGPPGNQKKKDEMNHGPAQAKRGREEAARVMCCSRVHLREKETSLKLNEAGPGPSNKEKRRTDEVRGR